MDVVGSVPLRRSAAERLGFRRVESVLLVRRDDGVSAVVTGVAHRLPYSRRVSLRQAADLITSGARWSTVDRRRVLPSVPRVGEQER